MRKQNSNDLLISLLLLLMLPSLFYVVGNLSSLSYGFCVGLFIFTTNILYKKNKFSLYVLTISILILLLLLISIILSVPSIKNMGSLFIMLLMLFSANIFSSFILECDSNYLVDLIKKITIILILCGLLGTFIKLNYFGYENFAKSVFIFYEPSNYAIVAGPFFIITMLTIPKIRIVLSLCFLFIAIMITNLTMIVYWFIGIILCIRQKKYILLFLTLISIVIISIYFSFSNYLNYYIERVSFSSESTNLSTLVYMQGWQEAYYAFYNTYGLGLGFQQAGTNHPTIIAEKIYSILGHYKNREDMGFFMAKIVVEFGMLGIIFIIYYINVLLFSFKNRNIDKGKLIIFGMLISSIVEVFFRSPGYFSIGIYFLFVALFYHIKTNQNFLSCEK
ncbi:hypothetical protein [Photobacterium damselae]